MRWGFVFLLMFPCFASVEAGSAIRQDVEGNGLSPDVWSGYYTKKSDLCTEPGNGASCSEKFRDVLNVKPSGQGYLVELNSTQANQHACYFSFQMEKAGDALVYKTRYGDVLLIQDSNALKVLSAGIDPTAFGLGVCGAHADINGLSFPLDNRVN